MQLIQRERKIKGKGGCLEMERESCLSHKVRFDKTQPLPRPRPRPMPDRTSRSSAAGMLPEVVRCSADNTATGDVRRDDVARWPRRRTNEHRRKPRHTNGGLIRTLEAVQAGTSEHGTEAPKGSLGSLKKSTRLGGVKTKGNPNWEERFRSKETEVAAR